MASVPMLGVALLICPTPSFNVHTSAGRGCPHWRRPVGKTCTGGPDFKRLPILNWFAPSPAGTGSTKLSNHLPLIMRRNHSDLVLLAHPVHPRDSQHTTHCYWQSLPETAAHYMPTIAYGFFRNLK
jgi:hypothetical protein